MLLNFSGVTMRKFGLAVLLAVLPTAAGAFSFSETIDGDLSGDNLNPTALVASLGSNTVSGSTVRGDLDYVRITLPNNLQLGSLVLTSLESADDVAFIAVQAGTTFTVTPATATADVLLGWAHFGSGPNAGGATVGNDMLDDLGTAPGAIGFTPPLVGSDFTFWIQQTSTVPFGYTLDFVAVPEPGSFALLGLGVAGLACWRRRGTGARTA